MSLLFLGAKDHRITATELKDLKDEFGRLNIETSRSVLEFYQSRNIPAMPAPARSVSPRLRRVEITEPGFCRARSPAQHTELWQPPTEASHCLSDRVFQADRRLRGRIRVPICRSSPRDQACRAV